MARKVEASKALKIKAPKKVKLSQAAYDRLEDRRDEERKEEAVLMAEDAKAKKSKTKRVSLNPQPILDAKTAALKERGVKLTWAGRKWHAGNREFTSLEMPKFSVDEFAKLFAK